MNVINVKNLNVTLNNHHILNDISFDVEKGQVVAIVGPNGSGKTTLLKALLGFVRYEGDVSILGVAPSQYYKISSRIGYVPQRLDFDRTIPITVRELLAIHSTASSDSFFQEILRLVGAEKLLEQTLGVLSGGQFQRVLIALSLLNKPDILFLDEPASSIDVEGAGEVYTLIDTLKKDRGMTILLVSHDIDIVTNYADTVLCINHRLICTGRPHEALTKETLETLYGSHHTVYPHKEKQ